MIAQQRMGAIGVIDVIAEQARPQLHPRCSQQTCGSIELKSAFDITTLRGECFGDADRIFERHAGALRKIL